MIDIEELLTTELVQHFSPIGGVHIGARALLDINLIEFGYIARLSRWGGGSVFTRSNDFYLPSLGLEEGGKDRHPVD
jgi:hypothetical protein